MSKRLIRSILNKKSYLRKIRKYHVLFRPITAYDPNNYEKFDFQGWMCLNIDNKFVFFKRHHDSTKEWHFLSWKDIFRKNWKYVGPKKEDYIHEKWYRLSYDFINKIVWVRN